jgi:hypothetical protein
MTRQRTGCPRCAKSGFDQTKPGVFYFIQHTELRARKVGIANQSSGRLKDWENNGWSLIFKYESENGLVVLNLETKMLRWIRKDLGLPAFLGKEEMGRFAGGTETFSIDGETNESIIKQAMLYLKETQAN